MAGQSKHVLFPSPRFAHIHSVTMATAFAYTATAVVLGPRPPSSTPRRPSLLSRRCSRVSSPPSLHLPPGTLFFVLFFKLCVLLPCWWLLWAHRISNLVKLPAFYFCFIERIISELFIFIFIFISLKESSQVCSRWWWKTKL